MTAREAFVAARDAYPAYRAAHPKNEDDSDAARVEVLDLQLGGLAAIMEGDVAGGIETLRQAAVRESQIPLHFGPPFIEKPSLELLGEVLIEAGRTDDAQTVLAEAEVLTPNRRALAEARTRLEEMGG